MNASLVSSGPLSPRIACGGPCRSSNWVTKVMTRTAGCGRQCRCPRPHGSPHRRKRKPPPTEAQIQYLVETLKVQLLFERQKRPHTIELRVELALEGAIARRRTDIAELRLEPAALDGDVAPADH